MVGPHEQDKRSVFVHAGGATGPCEEAEEEEEKEAEECSIPHVHVPHRRGNKVISS